MKRRRAGTPGIHRFSGRRRPRTSREIEEAAVRVAARRGLLRCQLDVLFWNAGGETR